MLERANLTFWNVGHGLFHTGVLSFHTLDFRYVFDCGSQPKCHAKRALTSVTSRADWEPSKPLDLLVLSHLHDDHFSGVPALVRGRPVDTVVMPYLTPLERLLLATTTRTSGARRRFLASPVATALEHWHAKRVILITRERPGVGDLPREPAEGLKVRLELDERAREESDEPNDRVEFRSTGGHIVVDVWIFVFFMRALDQAVLTAFSQVVAQVLGDTSQQRLRQAIENVDELKKLRDKAYKTINRNINLTSLAMYAGTAPGTATPFHRACVVANQSQSKLYVHSFTDSGGGVLLTGDLPLKTVEQPLTDKFLPFADRSNVFQAPHHGAHSEWSLPVFRRFGPIAVIPSRTGNRNHPSPRVLQDIFANDGVALWANEEQAQTVEFR